MFCNRLLCYRWLGDKIMMVIVMEYDYSIMGARIANRRKQLDIKQNNLAEMIDISNNYMSGIECGKENPSLEVFIKLCNALQVTPDYLLLGNMHSNNIPQNIYDGLRLCSDADVQLLSDFLQLLIQRNEKAWNDKNFV